MRARAGAAAEKPANLVETMCRQLADDIVEGVLLPGVRLDEAGLAERFATSRTPVREALRQLEAMGVVQRRPHRGVVVATVTAERLAQMFEAMAELEAVCARLAALRMTPKERHGLERLHLKAGEHVAAGHDARYEEANRLFHQAIYTGAHNDEIKALAEATRSRLAPFRRAQFRVAGRIAHSHAEHDQVVKAILAADAEAAATAMRVHLLTVRDTSEGYRQRRSR